MAAVSHLKNRREAKTRDSVDKVGSGKVWITPLDALLLDRHSVYQRRQSLLESLPPDTHGGRSPSSQEGRGEAGEDVGRRWRYREDGVHGLRQAVLSVQNVGLRRDRSA